MKKSNKKKSKVHSVKKTPYPWDQWLNPERTRSITISGDKFDPAPSIMTQQIYNCAKRRGLKVSLKVIDGSIKVVSVNKIKPATKKKKVAA